MSVPQDPLVPAAHTNDGFFKSIFSQPEHAVAFFKNHLPQPISTNVDWELLVVLPGSFVKSSLQQLQTDLLFSVRIGDQETLLYLLFEHQSTPDLGMSLRLLGYMTEIFTQHHKSQGLPLPPVLPFVLHQGPDHWNVSTTFGDLFALPENLAADLLQFLPNFRYSLLDLSRYDPATEERDGQMQVILQLMKLARQKELLRFFQWLAEFSVSKLSDHFIGKLLLYALHSDSDLDAEKIYHSLSNNPELKRNTMSVAEKLKSEGRVEGRTEGRTEGRVEGRTEGYWIGKIQTLEEFLGLPVSTTELLFKKDLGELETMQERLHRDYVLRFK